MKASSTPRGRGQGGQGQRGQRQPHPESFKGGSGRGHQRALSRGWRRRGRSGEVIGRKEAGAPGGIIRAEKLVQKTLRHGTEAGRNADGDAQRGNVAVTTALAPTME